MVLTAGRFAPAGAGPTRLAGLPGLPPGPASLVAQAQGRDERLLRDLDPADALHALLAFLLLLQQLALARDVAAVALGQHVLALGLDRLPGHDAATDRRLDRLVE